MGTAQTLSAKGGCPKSIRLLRRLDKMSFFGLISVEMIVTGTVLQHGMRQECVSCGCAQS